MGKIDRKAEGKTENKLSRSNFKLISTDEVSNLAESIINTVREPLIVLDKELRVDETNRSSYDGKYDRRKILIDSTLKNANILIVDDQQANIDVLVGLLELKGFINIKTTTDSRLAVSLFEEFKPDLLLLDLKMPHLNGFQVIEQLKPLIPTGTYFPILILTADITPEARQLSLSSGATDFLAKPFDLIEVDLRINSLLKIRYF